MIRMTNNLSILFLIGCIALPVMCGCSKTISKHDLDRSPIVNAFLSYSEGENELVRNAVLFPIKTIPGHSLALKGGYYDAENGGVLYELQPNADSCVVEYYSRGWDYTYSLVVEFTTIDAIQIRKMIFLHGFSPPGESWDVDADNGLCELKFDESDEVYRAHAQMKSRWFPEIISDLELFLVFERGSLP